MINTKTLSIKELRKEEHNFFSLMRFQNKIYNQMCEKYLIKDNSLLQKYCT